MLKDVLDVIQITVMMNSSMLKYKDENCLLMSVDGDLQRL
jgi:hypothetical protein